MYAIIKFDENYNKMKKKIIKKNKNPNSRNRPKIVERGKIDTPSQLNVLAWYGYFNKKVKFVIRAQTSPFRDMMR